MILMFLFGSFIKKKFLKSEKKEKTFILYFRNKSMKRKEEVRRRKGGRQAGREGEGES